MLRTVTPEELVAPAVDIARARALVVGLVEGPLVAQVVTVAEALGRVAADKVVAPADVPPFVNSAMDGWAVSAARHSSTGDELQPVGRIATGAPLPEGADSVIPWEHVIGGVVTRPVTPGQYVRTAGHDLVAGETVVAGGVTLDALHLGALAGIGATTIAVYRTPVVGLLVSGDEVVPPGTPLGPGQVHDVNSTLLSALVRELGAVVGPVSRVGDDLAATVDGLTVLSTRCDVVVTTGGASVGERDWVRTALERHGELAFWRVDVRPGKPVAAGRLGETPLLMLPGNPGSVVSGVHLFLAPLLRHLTGRPVAAPTTSAALTESVANPGERPFLCPVRVADGRATPLVGRSSQAIGHLGGAGGFVLVPSATTLPADTPVLVEQR